MIDILVDATFVVLILLVLFKTILWLKLKKRSKVGLLVSFLMWYSKMSIHDSDTEQEKIFKIWSNRINTLVLVCGLLLLVLFVFNTDYTLEKESNNPYRRLR